MGGNGMRSAGNSGNGEKLEWERDVMFGNGNWDGNYFMRIREMMSQYSLVSRFISLTLFRSLTTLCIFSNRDPNPKPTLVKVNLKQ